MDMCCCSVSFPFLRQCNTKCCPNNQLCRIRKAEIGPDESSNGVDLNSVSDNAAIMSKTLRDRDTGTESLTAGGCKKGGKVDECDGPFQCCCTNIWGVAPSLEGRCSYSCCNLPSFWPAPGPADPEMWPPRKQQEEGHDKAQADRMRGHEVLSHGSTQMMQGFSLVCDGQKDNKIGSGSFVDVCAMVHGAHCADDGNFVPTFDGNQDCDSRCGCQAD